ncbi:collagen alpha-1(I) chain-like [Pipra filicauda]|uniref:Collagen alpha-1(I) chain-like n=1 Tax=Pipra filicauda TaxID=649802 RepID=A0A7R5K7X0_9PASS|nr:collagen alpha-1(I) chain-like [Pipra filicauda]
MGVGAVPVEAELLRGERRSEAHCRSASSPLPAADSRPTTSPLLPGPPCRTVRLRDPEPPRVPVRGSPRGSAGALGPGPRGCSPTKGRGRGRGPGSGTRDGHGPAGRAPPTRPSSLLLATRAPPATPRAPGPANPGPRQRLARQSRPAFLGAVQSQPAFSIRQRSRKLCPLSRGAAPPSGTVPPFPSGAAGTTEGRPGLQRYPGADLGRGSRKLRQRQQKAENLELRQQSWWRHKDGRTVGRTRVGLD